LGRGDDGVAGRGNQGVRGLVGSAILVAVHAVIGGRCYVGISINFT
jgi:S-adenosylmethionine synthetase